MFSWMPLSDTLHSFSELIGLQAKEEQELLPLRETWKWETKVVRFINLTTESQLLMSCGGEKGAYLGYGKKMSLQSWGLGFIVNISSRVIPCNWGHHDARCENIENFLQASNYPSLIWHLVRSLPTDCFVTVRWFFLQFFLLRWKAALDDQDVKG